LGHNQNPSAGQARDEIRKSYDLAPGALVEISGINGAVKIETSNSKTADVYIERTGDSQEALNRRKIIIDNGPSGLTIRGEKGDAGFLARVFGSSPSERVTLRLPREVSLVTRGINGAVVVGEIEGPVEVHGINGRVQISAASGSAEFSGINGNVSVGLIKLDKNFEMRGINGNIELRLGDGVNANLETHGMNGSVTSNMSNVVVDKSKRGSYSAVIGRGGTAITAHGINGNIRLSQLGEAEPIGDR
jgi:ribosomal 30S subunit maturation factor RimM